MYDAMPRQVTVIMNQVKDHGYCAHIPRLMIVGAWFLMNGYHPKLAYDWFLNNFIDSYDWVMYGNVYGMLYYMLRIMKRPYYCSYNYIRKMTNMNEDADKWNAAFYEFMQGNKDKFDDYISLGLLAKIDKK
jgi:deoxyribodipyrimidine photolyase-related protein